MHVVVIHGWKVETLEFVQALSVALGIMPYEIRQRMIGGGPSVVACFADPERAGALSAKLNECKVPTLIIDVHDLRSKSGRFIVRRFELKEGVLQVERNDGQTELIPFGEIDLLLTGTRIQEGSETVTVTERKLSLGKTLLSGGIPMTKTVKRQEEVTREERENILSLYAGDRGPIVFCQGGMTYEGFGAEMKLSQELNFAYLRKELRRLCPAAGFDDRLQTRLGQVRLLGPSLSPEKNLDLAFDILARSLRGKLMTG